MMLTRTFSPVEFISYQFILAWISEDMGGVRTAYFYDLALRQDLSCFLHAAGSILCADQVFKKRRATLP